MKITQLSSLLCFPSSSSSSSAAAAAEKRRRKRMLEGSVSRMKSLMKNLLRMVSQKGFLRTVLMGFLCGLCVAYFVLPAITDVRIGVPVSKQGCDEGGRVMGINNTDTVTVDGISKDGGSELSNRTFIDTRISLLYSAWKTQLRNKDSDKSVSISGIGWNIPRAPHLEDCKASTRLKKLLDTEGLPRSRAIQFLQDEYFNVSDATREGDIIESLSKTREAHPDPPWVLGADEDNFPLTRKVQQDIWIHQHPKECADPQIKFLVADWEREPGFGIGAQIAGMIGLLGIAVTEKRVLVTGYYNRADHDGCSGSSRSHWSCYFLPETSFECRQRALLLLGNDEAVKNGTVTMKSNYTTKIIFHKAPRVWGTPWVGIQPTTDIDGVLLRKHRKMELRWWRAQAVRYLMRFTTEYTCELLNIARHEEFGLQAAEMVVKTLPDGWPKESAEEPVREMEKYVWSNWKPWMPTPLLSMHVRMGDKAVEKAVSPFEKYMELAERIRKYFPNLRYIWLSTEMQAVIDAAKKYKAWNFYYTKNVPRQVGNTSMANYEASLGRETSTNYPLVNFLMATEADFFVGALGSTWCFLIDGMRQTGGKVMSGYLSVNKDRFW